MIPAPADNRSDEEKARALMSIGWMPAGYGKGPLGEKEWWPPGYIEVPTLTCDFAEAYRLTVLAWQHRQQAMGKRT